MQKKSLSFTLTYNCNHCNLPAITLTSKVNYVPGSTIAYIQASLI